MTYSGSHGRPDPSVRSSRWTVAPVLGKTGLMALVLALALSCTLGMFLERQWTFFQRDELFETGGMVLVALALLATIAMVVTQLRRQRLLLELRKEKAERSEQERDHLWNTPLCGHLLLDGDGIILQANKTAQTVLGYAEEEMVGRSIQQYLLVDALPRSEILFRGAEDPLEITFRHRTGCLIHGRACLREAFPPGSGQLHLAWVDTSDRVSAQQQLQELHRRLELAQTQAAERLSLAMTAGQLGIWEWDVLQDRTEWSANIFSMVSASPEQTVMTLEGFLDLVYPQDREALQAQIEHGLRDPTQGELHLQFRVPTPQGEPRWMENQARIFRDASGRAVRVQGTIMDVTERRHTEEELSKVRDSTLAEAQAKSNFLANMSHEIRTPLNGIIGAVEMLSQTTILPQQQQYLATLSQSAESLLALINDILDFSKIEAGKLDLEAIPFDLIELIQGAIRVVSPQAEAKGLRLDIRHTEVPPVVVGDPARLRQVLLNLLSNAVKFTLTGEVLLQVEQEQAGREDPTSLIRFEVLDTGMGIAEDRFQAIFEPFTQGDVSTTRTHGGTGLGLSIAARLVERMGGTLRVRSTLGQGSTFWFTIPLPRGDSLPTPLPRPRSRPAASHPSSDQPTRVLLVEDNLVNQQVMTLLLQKAGYQVVLACNGKEALERFEQQRFDLVLMDVQMPEMDGLRTTRLLRAREKVLGGHVPIVAVTANALAGERNRCVSAGMDDYLAKPVRGSELFPLIERLLGEQHVSARASIPGTLPINGRTWHAPLVRMGFQSDEIQRLTQTFVETVPPRLVTLREALAQGDAPLVQLTAHSLKGALAVFAATEAVEQALRLEIMGRQGELEGAEQVLSHLIAELEPLLASMRRELEKSSPLLE